MFDYLFSLFPSNYSSSFSEDAFSQSTFPGPPPPPPPSFENDICSEPPQLPMPVVNAPPGTFYQPPVPLEAYAVPSGPLPTINAPAPQSSMPPCIASGAYTTALLGQVGGGGYFCFVGIRVLQETKNWQFTVNLVDIESHIPNLAFLDAAIKWWFWETINCWLALHLFKYWQLLWNFNVTILERCTLVQSFVFSLLPRIPHFPVFFFLFFPPSPLFLFFPPPPPHIVLAPCSHSGACYPSELCYGRTGSTFRYLSLWFDGYSILDALGWMLLDTFGEVLLFSFCYEWRV